VTFRPLLTKLVDGKKRLMYASDSTRALLARWAAKTADVLNRQQLPPDRPS
jgi:hypothetical protein